MDDEAPSAPPTAEAKPPAPKWQPWVTYALIAVNAAFFVYELGVGASLSGATPQKMIEMGGNYAPLTRDGEPWRLVTSMFLHDGGLHIAMNMFCLYQVRVIEKVVGRAEYLALYFASGVIGGVVSITRQPHAVSAGASGAVFGLFGVYAAVMIAKRSVIDPELWARELKRLGIFFAINFIYGWQSTGIDMSAHVGGLVSGFVGGYVVVRTAKATSNHALRGAIVAILGAGIALGGLQLLPAPHDYAALLQEFDRYEASTLARYNELVTTWPDTAKASPQLADALEHDVIAPTIAMQAKVKAFPIDDISPNRHALFSHLLSYLDVRIAFYRQLEQLARTPDPGVLEMVKQSKKAVDSELDSLNAEIPAR